jgi:hypothetical protein
MVYRAKLSQVHSKLVIQYVAPKQLTNAVTVSLAISVLIQQVVQLRSAPTIAISPVLPPTKVIFSLLFALRKIEI